MDVMLQSVHAQIKRCLRVKSFVHIASNLSLVALGPGKIMFMCYQASIPGRLSYKADVLHPYLLC